ncbi:MAG TPA: T9SS type A sorting domain-containing protein, partial [Chryseosolibacter sp.]|nr:T9SS type A sorting domain-containing protein [Chryseosolibacter sp.]
HIFPNPAVEYVHVRTVDVPASKIKLAVHNILGNKMEIETEIVDEYELRVRVKDLSSGYYLLAIKDEDAKFRGTFKFLKR